MTTGTDSAHDHDGTEKTGGRATPDDIRREIMEQQRIAEAWFDDPSSDVYRLLWQVCGAWETVIEEVRFFHYVLDENPPTEPPFPHPDGENVARDLRRIARKLNLRLPSNTIWTDECKRAKSMRDDLGHMLHFTAVTGDRPNQAVEVLRVPYKEPDEMTTDGNWARHNRKKVTITQADARDVLAGLKFVKTSIFALRKFGVEFNIWPDTEDIEYVLRIMPWWLNDWGQPGDPGWTVPTMRQLRVVPQAEYIEALPESQQPEDWPRA